MAFWFLLVGSLWSHSWTRSKHTPAENVWRKQHIRLSTRPRSHKPQRQRTHSMYVARDQHILRRVHKADSTIQGVQSISLPLIYFLLPFSSQCRKNVMRETIILQNPGAGGEPPIQRKQNVNDTERDQDP